MKLSQSRLKLTASGDHPTKKTQRFSNSESSALKEALDQHLLEHGYDLSQAYEVLRLGREPGKRRNRVAIDWVEVARVCPDRSVQACYDHVGRIVMHDARKGQWTPDECATLRRLIIEHGVLDHGQSTRNSCCGVWSNRLCN
eukprot:tig00000217_g19165.t1